MRSVLDVRICHLLRVMRAVAPVEWSLGLPFPSGAVMADVARATDAQDASFASWFESRARAWQSSLSDPLQRPLAA